MSIIHEVLISHGVNPAVCTLLPSGQEATSALLQAIGLVDLVIPRGSSSLINYVRENARVPVIETGAGVCHTYFDRDGDKEKGIRIIHNASKLINIGGIVSPAPRITPLIMNIVEKIIMNGQTMSK